ncbi:MAG: hypothetical protein CM1200mP24_04100 [Gammaproteobacteria bacterium]|nr:MAG: hypothetical protein CM1200mP24_04100 [Gammaproteobacteria bacterium]
MQPSIGRPRKIDYGRPLGISTILKLKYGYGLVNDFSVTAIDSTGRCLALGLSSVETTDYLEINNDQ